MSGVRERETKRAMGRRCFIRWAMGAGAALSVPRWKVFEILGASGGQALADEAACGTTNRSVHIVAGDGSFAWFHLLWPHTDIAAARDPRFSYHAIGDEISATGTDRPLVLGPEAPWRNLGGGRQVTAMLAGTNETHSRMPFTSSTIADGSSLFAAVATLQLATQTLVPVIVVDDAPYGSAPGAPRVARVDSADGIVSLFDSAASRAGGALSVTEDADLFAAHYRALVSLHSVAGLPATERAFSTGRTAAELLGTNLAAALTPSPADLARYGIEAGSPDKCIEFAKGLCIAAKAFAMGLTNSVILPFFRDDPHGAFNDMGVLQTTVRSMGTSLDAFLADLGTGEDPTCAGTSLADNVVVSIHGDTPKNPLDRSAWPDGTPGSANWCYVLGAGWLKTGWFGGIQRDGTVRGWDPATGEENDSDSESTAPAAAAAIAYAVAKGDERRVQDFARGTEIAGIVRADLTG